jgi:TM2 domain-containing membrane protein YozV
MSGASFGRKGSATAQSDLAARRAAFLAAERARPRQEPRPDEELIAPRQGPPIAPKAAGTAYVLWFFAGGLSAHRFYLGFPVSGIMQLVLTPTGYMLMLSKSPSGLLVTVVAGLWILADAFLIPGMIRKANARGRGVNLASTFA